MKAGSYKFKTVDEYMDTLPEHTRSILEKLRKAIKQAAPKAKEVISYNMPAYRQHGVLVYFAATKNHIGFYPTSSGVLVFKEELAGYDTSKGSIRFPMEKPLPLTLVKEIVKFRMAEDLEKEKIKKLK